MYGRKYILPFTNDLNELYEVMFDVLNYSGPVTTLTPTDDCLTIRSTQGDENKLEPILGSEALINIWIDETTNLSISDFIATHDNDILITVYRNENYTSAVFQGFIVVEDNSQVFADPPFTLSLRALDGLGLLKGVDLGDLNNLRFVGRYSIIEWIAQILYKTGQMLNIRVYFNLYESSFNQSIGALEQVYLDAITFSQGDAFNPNPTDPTVDVLKTSADDCYTALEKIVRCLRCRLFMENGVWNLVSLYEYLNPAGMRYKEYAFGSITNGIVGVNAVGAGQGLDFSAPVGKEEIIHAVGEDQNLYLKLATKWIKLTYTYDQSQNKVCNQNFSEGTRDPSLDQTLSSSIIDPTISPVVNLTCQGWDAYCWNHFNGAYNTGTGVANPFPQSAADHHAYIRVVLDAYQYEMQRFLVIEPSTAPTYMESAADFLLDVGDAIKISMDVRTKNGHAGTVSYGFMWALLTADDGTFWALNCIEGPGVNNPAANKAVWQQVNSLFQNSFGNTPQAQYLGTSAQASNQWINVTAGGYLPATTPVSGRVRIYLSNASTYNDELWIKNLTVDITPFLQGSYTALKGDYNYSASNNTIKKTESDDVEISDSPKRYFKGALLRANGDLCLPQWSRFGVIESYRFTQLMERIMYINLSRINQKIEGTFRGLIYCPDPATEIPAGMINSYYFTDHERPTKRFMMTSYEKQIFTGQARCVFVETLADVNDDGFAAPDVYQFSYIFQ
jgi:hypothetical protein